jgi:rhodanese-related sulfurtransferase
MRRGSAVVETVERRKNFILKFLIKILRTKNFPTPGCEATAPPPLIHVKASQGQPQYIRYMEYNRRHAMTFLPRLTAPALVALSLALAPHTALAETFTLQDPVAIENLSKSKQTAPGLYITAAEAGRILKDKANVALIDVRTPSETMLIGYPVAAAANIPSKLVDPELEFDPKKGVYMMVDNPTFVAEMQAWLASDAAEGVDTLMIMCRSGSRSAAAIGKLVEAGVDVTLYNVVDGFEGDKNDAGVRAMNGWRNAGLPWTYKVREGLWPGHN